MERIPKYENLEGGLDYELFDRERNLTLNHDIERSLSTTLTMEVMDICKIKIIGPFNILLTMVGWRSLTTQFQYSEKYSLLIKCLDKILLICFIGLLIFSYVYQGMVCRYQINTNYKIITVDPMITTKSSIQNSSTIMSTERTFSTITETQAKENGTYSFCEHVSTTYIIPNVLHFIAYIIGLIHYRYNENEDIYGLMEKTLQYSTTFGAKRKHCTNVTKMLTFWMGMAFLWLLLAIVNHILCDILFVKYSKSGFIRYEGSDYKRGLNYILFVLDFLGYIISCFVTVFIVLNYIIYCELANLYVNAISKKIEARCIKLNTIKTDIQNVSGTISLINGMTGKMMTLIFILKVNLFIVGIYNLLMAPNDVKLNLAYRFYFVLHLIPLILVALIQCVRVNHAMKTFKKWGRHMSVFGYRKESRKYLDSFLLFTISFNSRARLMAIPIEWWQLLVFFFLSGFTLITMIQTGMLDKIPLLRNL